MTIKKRLILSHLLVFIVPILMTAVVLVTIAAGLWKFSQSNNHVAVESTPQFNYISQTVHHILLRAMEGDPSQGENMTWLLHILEPKQSYILATKDGRPFYTYGDKTLRPLTAHIVGKAAAATGKKEVYTETTPTTYYYYETGTINGSPYTLCMVSKQMLYSTDRAIENATRQGLWVILISFVLILLLTIIFLSHFIMRHILPPLQKLQDGAEEIKNGNLQVQLHHTAHDEFEKPLAMFNVMTAALHHSLEAQTAAESARKELLASISHDLRTPLTSIKAYVEGLLDHVARTPEQQERYLQTIRRKADDMDRMLDQLFMFSKLDLPTFGTELQPLALSQVVTGLLEANEAEWRQKGAVIETVLDPTARIDGDAALLERILTNLIANSINYKTADTVHIVITTAVTDAAATLSVTDDGPGVAVEDLPKLSALFFRTNRARSDVAKGSGLGLSIVTKAAAKMRGRTQFAAVQPHGLAVSITFPQKEAVRK